MPQDPICYLCRASQSLKISEVPKLGQLLSESSPHLILYQIFVFLWFNHSHPNGSSDYTTIYISFKIYVNKAIKLQFHVTFKNNKIVYILSSGSTMLNCLLKQHSLIAAQNLNGRCFDFKFHILLCTSWEPIYVTIAVQHEPSLAEVKGESNFMKNQDPLTRSWFLGHQQTHLLCQQCWAGAQ